MMIDIGLAELRNPEATLQGRTEGGKAEKKEAKDLQEGKDKKAEDETNNFMAHGRCATQKSGGG